MDFIPFEMKGTNNAMSLAEDSDISDSGSVLMIVEKVAPSNFRGVKLHPAVRESRVISCFSG